MLTLMTPRVAQKNHIYTLQGVVRLYFLIRNDMHTSVFWWITSFVQTKL